MLELVVRSHTCVSGGIVTVLVAVCVADCCATCVHVVVRRTVLTAARYGVLNITNDPSGVRACEQYGESYLVLKNVRLRTTFADKDSSSPSTTLATCEYYCHVLNTYSNPELMAVMDVQEAKLGKSCV